MLRSFVRDPRSHVASKLPGLLRLPLAAIAVATILLAGVGAAQAVPAPSIHNAIRPMKPCDTGTGLNSEGAPCSSEDLSMDSSRTNYGGPFEFGANDDDSIPAAIGFGVNFFGLQADTLYINNNGNVTFDSALSTYTPFDLTSTSRVIIAPYFSDVDTRIGNEVRYGRGTVDGHNAFAVNWPGVGCYDKITTVLNYFQVILIDLVMSGDNAIIIGMAVAGLPKESRGKIIFWGVAGATVPVDLRMEKTVLPIQAIEVVVGSRAHHTAWPRPSGRCWRVKIALPGLMVASCVCCSSRALPRCCSVASSS